MIATPRQKVYLAIATVVFLSHLVVATLAKPSLSLTMYGDGIPFVFLILALLAIRENLRIAPGTLPMFWKVFSGGLVVTLISQVYWFYFDIRRITSVPSSVVGDCLFLIAQVFFLSALALRPYSTASGQYPNVRVRGLDFALLSFWWLCLYGYFALPWYVLFNDTYRYNIDYCVVSSLEDLLIVIVLGILCLKKQGAWRLFYFQLMVVFLLFAIGNILMSGLVPGYYPGSFYDTPFLFAIFLFTPIACFGSSLQQHPDTTPNRELVVSVWAARFAMAVMLSLPVVALCDLRFHELPFAVMFFRLRLIFGCMFVFGALVYGKFTLLTRELVRLVRLTQHSIEDLKNVQQQVSQTEKFVALGRLAAGAAHEISNPLTAILGYSELLSDVPSLSFEDRAHAQSIREQVHRAQAAVASLRHSMSVRAASRSASLLNDKKTLS
jgi:signal transduction histidine kinase